MLVNMEQIFLCVVGDYFGNEDIGFLGRFNVEFGV